MIVTSESVDYIRHYQDNYGDTGLYAGMSCNNIRHHSTHRGQQSLWWYLQYLLTHGYFVVLKVRNAVITFYLASHSLSSQLGRTSLLLSSLMEQSIKVTHMHRPSIRIHTPPPPPQLSAPKVETASLMISLWEVWQHPPTDGTEILVGAF